MASVAPPIRFVGTRLTRAVRHIVHGNATYECGVKRTGNIRRAARAELLRIRLDRNCLVCRKTTRFVLATIATCVFLRACQHSPLSHCSNHGDDRDDDPEREELMRDSRGRCVRCRPGEVGQLVGLINDHDPSRRFDGYTDTVASAKKVRR